MNTKRITIPTLVISSMAFGACTDAGEDVPLEPGDFVEVYHQDDDGNETPLGYYEPDSQQFNQTPVGWDFEGYWFEAGDELIEVRGTDGALQTEVALEVGASYDANLLRTISDSSEDAIAQGVIVVDTVAAEVGGFEPAGYNYCRVVATWGKMNWSKGSCRKYTKYKCHGGATYTKSRKTNLGYCIKN